MEHEATVPVQKLVQEIESKQNATSEPVPTAKQTEERVVISEVISQNVGKEGKPNNTDTCSTRGEQKRSGISSGKPLSVLTSITSQAAESGLLLNLPDTAKNDRQRLVKSDFVYLTTDNVKDVEKTEKDGSSVKFTLPTSPTFGPKVISDVSTARSPTFRDVLQELIQQHAQRKSAASSHEGAPRKNIQEKTPPQLSGSTSATAESATCPSLARKNFPLKGPVKTSSFLLNPQGVTSNSTPAMSPRFYTRRIEGSEMLCSAVQITTNAVVNEECANKTLGYGGKLSLEIKNRASPGSLNFPTTAAEESRPQLVKSFLLHTVGDDGKQDQKRAAAMQQVRHRRSSDSFVTNVDKKPSIVYASGDSFSGSVETPSDESKLEGYVSPNSPRNNGPGQAISLSQELQTTQAVVNHGLERMFMFSRIENNWSLTSPKAILGSMDIESSETSLGGLRATFKQSAGACQMVVPRDETTVAVPARKDKKTKGSKQKKRVNFHEKPFADVLAEIEHSYSDPGKVKIMEGGKEAFLSKGDTAAEVSTGRSNNEDKESCDDIFMQYCRGAADKNSIREGESEDGKKEKTWTPPLSIEQDVGGQQVNTQIMEQVGAQAKHKEAGRSLVEWCGPQELAVRNNELSLPNSREAVSEESLVSHPFCPSNEGPLVTSASATLSFLSSQSCVSVVHRMTDLTVLDSLADLATPFQETGDEKSRTAAANLPYTSKPDSRALKGIHHSLRGALSQYQQGEQQWKGHSLLSTSRQTSAERSACSSRRLRKLEQANRQDSREERSRPLKRPNTDESQHTGRFAAKEQRWGDDIIQVILMGNKHYLRQRSLTSPRPLSPSMAAVPPLDETRYIAQQIELTHAIKEDVAHTCPSPELCLAAGVVRTVAVPEETVITPAYARDLSACDATRASARASDTGLDQKMPSSPSSKASPQSFPGTCSGPLFVVRSPDSLGATHRGTWSLSGEQPKMEMIAEAVCEIEMQDPQAVSEALGSKISKSVTGDVSSGDKIELDKSRVQISVIEGSTDHFVPSLTFELGSESRLTPTWPQWDAPARDLLAPVKLLSAAVGTPESFSKTIGLPSAEGLLMSDTSTPASSVDTAVPSSKDCSVVLEASASALPHARTGRPKIVRSSSHSAKIIDGPCFESIYNSILQRGSSPGLSLSIPTLGSRDSAGLFGVRERPERSASEYSTILSRHDDSTDSGAVEIVATNSRSVSLAPGFSDPQPSESCFHQALVQRTIDAAAVFVEDAKKSDDEQKKSTPPPSGQTPPNYNSGSGVSHSSNDLPQGDVVVNDIQDDN
ncbi:hypothetical protein V5799_022695 [Amblyomma americanum]|uniref:Uncharacterized protein n=1 Tax=Amblyomma americanum TaxID=6943 RepID=A0AAQ4FLC9_AMBAM